MSKKIMTIEIEIDMNSKRAKEWKHSGQYFDDEIDQAFDAIQSTHWNGKQSRDYENDYETETGNKIKVSIS